MSRHADVRRHTAAGEGFTWSSTISGPRAMNETFHIAQPGWVEYMLGLLLLLVIAE